MPSSSCPRRTFTIYIAATTACTVLVITLVYLFRFGRRHQIVSDSRLIIENEQLLTPPGDSVTSDDVEPVKARTDHVGRYVDSRRDRFFTFLRKFTHVPSADDQGGDASYTLPTDTHGNRISLIRGPMNGGGPVKDHLIQSKTLKKLQREARDSLCDKGESDDACAVKIAHDISEFVDYENLCSPMVKGPGRAEYLETTLQILRPVVDDLKRKTLVLGTGDEFFRGRGGRAR
jgi:hypothetical protein